MQKFVSFLTQKFPDLTLEITAVPVCTSLVPTPHPLQGKRIWGLVSVFLVVHHQQSYFQVNQSDHSFCTVI